jgi:hypothetical protein
MKRWIARVGLFVVLALPAMGLRPSGWNYATQPGQQFLYSNQSGKWYFVQPSPAACAANMSTALWFPFENTALRSGWSYWQWPYAYDADTGNWYFLADESAPWLYDFAEQQWHKMGAPTVNLSSGTWSASAANTYSLWVTVNTQNRVSSAYLKVYYNDGWFGSDAYTFSSSDITQSGSSFLAKKERAVINSAGTSLYYYEIAGTFQANGTITGTYKASYYQDPSWTYARTNTKQGNFTAAR